MNYTLTIHTSFFNRNVFRTRNLLSLLFTHLENEDCLHTQKWLACPYCLEKLIIRITLVEDKSNCWVACFFNRFVRLLLCCVNYCVIAYASSVLWHNRNFWISDIEYWQSPVYFVCLHSCYQYIDTHDWFSTNHWMKCSKGSLVDVNTIYWNGLILVIIYTVIAPPTCVIFSFYILFCNHILESRNGILMYLK